MKVTLRRFACVLIMICLLVPLAMAAKQEQPVPGFCKPILASWNATTAEELHLNIVEYWKASATSHPKAYSAKYFPCSIRFGGTTKELIADKENWDLAMVSSGDVDLQLLADAGLVMKTGYNPSNEFALHQWLLPANLQALLPSDPLMLYSIYCYDYDPQTGEAIFLVCQDDIGSKKNNPRMPYRFAAEIMRKRKADDVRALEGMRIVEAWTKSKLLVADRVHFTDGMRPIDAWTENELVSHADEWDAAIVIMESNDQLELLDCADLLYDFSNDDYFSARQALHPDYCLELVPGIFSSDGRMISIPCRALQSNDMGTECVMILNNQGNNIERALLYAVHFMKSNEWNWSAENKMWPHGCDTCIYKEEVTW